MKLVSFMNIKKEGFNTGCRAYWSAARFTSCSSIESAGWAGRAGGDGKGGSFNKAFTMTVAAVGYLGVAAHISNAALWFEPLCWTYFRALQKSSWITPKNSQDYLDISKKSPGDLFGLIKVFLMTEKFRFAYLQLLNSSKARSNINELSSKCIHGI